MNAHEESPSLRRRLWQGSSVSDNERGSETNETYQATLGRFSSRPAQRSLRLLCCNALVVGQEFALVCFLLARHQVALEDEHQRLSPGLLQQRIDRSTFAILSALVVVLFYSAKSAKVSLQDRKAKAKQRLTDAFLLAVLLRFAASVLRTLTASYSSDTVQALAIAGMIVHLLVCDYSYANGKAPITASHRLSTLSSQRPIFQGGTVSLNAALFSTTLLASRLSSNLTAYFFVTLTIVAFAFYPATRHAVSASFHPLESPAMWLVTAAVVAAVVSLLEQPRQIVLFSATLVAICLVVPCWKYVLQRHKVLIRGPWDIPSVSKMQLDST